MAVLSNITKFPGAVWRSNVKGQDVVVGAGIGLVGIWGFKWILRQGWATPVSKMLPAALQKMIPFLGGALSGLVVYLVERKNPSRALGHALGAVATGVAINAAAILLDNFPSLVATSDVRLSGLLMANPAHQLQGYGALAANPRRMMNGYGGNPAGMGALVNAASRDPDTDV